MTAVMQGLLVFAGLLLLLPVATLFLQVLASLPPRRNAQMPDGPRPRIAVLVPAHNEEHAIGQTLASIARQLDPGDRLVVIADNCSDRTAEGAYRQGAEVAVRHDPARCGKGYALDHGLRFLEQSGAPDVVIFVDADCQLSWGCIDRLALSCVQTMRPVQAAYLMAPARTASKKSAVAAFAWRVKDYVRPLGCHRLGLPCQLAGSGMAFPWAVARSTNLATGHLAEDLKQGIDLALLGKYPFFCPDAAVTSEVAAGGEPSGTQRARWEHGTLEIILQYLPRLLRRFCQAPSLALLAVALDLSVPPLALLALMVGGELALTLGFFWIFGAAAPATLAAVIGAIFFMTIVLAWWRHGQDTIPLRWLLFAPVYAISKVPLYGRFLVNRQREWARGGR